MTDVTRILNAIEQGDPHASAELLPLVYEQLRKLAARELKRNLAGNSLQPTVLVHEAYIRLVDQDDEPEWNHRGHFYAAAAQSIRRILVESIRRKGAVKRGGEFKRQPLDDEQLASPQPGEDLVALDEALKRLAEIKPQIAELVSLRYFAGLKMTQAAQALGIPLRTAERNWTYAKAWLLEELKRPE